MWCPEGESRRSCSDWLLQKGPDGIWISRKTSNTKSTKKSIVCANHRRRSKQCFNWGSEAAEWKNWLGIGMVAQSYGAKTDFSQTCKRGSAAKITIVCGVTSCMVRMVACKPNAEKFGRATALHNVDWVVFSVEFKIFSKLVGRKSIMTAKVDGVVFTRTMASLRI